MSHIVVANQLPDSQSGFVYRIPATTQNNNDIIYETINESKDESVIFDSALRYKPDTFNNLQEKCGKQISQYLKIENDEYKFRSIKRRKFVFNDRKFVPTPSRGYKIFSLTLILMFYKN